MSREEWGLWDERREQWIRRGYQTAREAGVARDEIERHFRDDDDTNLQVKHAPVLSPKEEQ